MVSEHLWKVVPLSEGQLRDVRPDDIIDGGLYRRCDTYRGGGGYDQFPDIAGRRWQRPSTYFRQQFVVQLRGCNLDCPYCYVTREGVWGSSVSVTTSSLVDAFHRSGQQVFHLMGGAPALQMKFWPELLDALGPDVTFHSDLLLTERVYQWNILRDIERANALYAVDVKGTTKEEWKRNTRTSWDEDLFWANWILVQLLGVPAYVTFTACEKEGIERFWEEAFGRGIEERWREEAFNIDLIDYEAVKFVDRVPWGGKMFTVVEEVAQLQRGLRRHNWLYYIKAKPEITDAEYDALFGRLKLLESQNPELVTSNSPTQTVGSPPKEPNE